MFENAEDVSHDPADDELTVDDPRPQSIRASAWAAPEIVETIADSDDARSDESSGQGAAGDEARARRRRPESAT